MKTSRLTAVGLVAAAGLWIASGHFLPHESAESKAALRAAVKTEAAYHAFVGSRRNMAALKRWLSINLTP